MPSSAPSNDDPSAANARPTLGELLRRFRVRAGLSQEALSERSGLSASAIGAIEQGVRRQPHRHTAKVLAEALGLAPNEHAALVALTSPAELDAAPEPQAPAAASLLRLPLPPTTLIGRDAEVAAVYALLDPSGRATRLLTLLGAGGVGKTRLALAVAERLLDAYADGVVFVDLVPLRDAHLVPATIGHAVQVAESGGGSARELLLEYLAERRLLLVLDNFEHLLAAAPLLPELLASCPRVSLLVTSRTALRLRGEQRFPVRPLATPLVQPNQTIESVADSPAVRLFVERAQSVAPDFALSAANASSWRRCVGAWRVCPCRSSLRRHGWTCSSRRRYCTVSTVGCSC